MAKNVTAAAHRCHYFLVDFKSPFGKIVTHNVGQIGTRFAPHPTTAMQLREAFVQCRVFGVLDLVSTTLTLQAIALEILTHPGGARHKTLACEGICFFTPLAVSIYCVFGVFFQGSVLPAHRAVLVARCDVMAAMFSGKYAEARSRVVPIHGVSSDTFLSFLEYLYTDSCCPGTFTGMPTTCHKTISSFFVRPH